MQSELERYIVQKLRELRAGLRYRDRAVIVGTALSFIPIPPACIIGFLMSIFNLFLIRFGKLRQEEGMLLKISVAVGFFNSLVGTYIILHIGFEFFTTISNIISSIFNFLDINIFEEVETNGLNA